MKRSYDEYRKLYNETSIKNGMEKDFDIWLAKTWLSDRFPSMRYPAKTKQEGLHRVKYLNQTIKKRLIEEFERDSQLADTLLKGMNKLEILSEYAILLKRESYIESKIKKEIPIIYNEYFKE